MKDRALPLAGRRVVVTRPEEDAPELVGLLEAAGATPLTLPLTGVEPPLDSAPLQQALARLESYDWVIFTSARAVRAASATLPEGRWPRGVRIAVVGEATAAETRRHAGRPPDIVPAAGGGGGIVPAILREHTLRDARVLWPRAEQPRPELPCDLEQAGAILDAPVAYRTVPYPETAAALAVLAEAGNVDAITLTAPSAVDCLAEAVTGELRCVVAVIGPSTAAAARERGLTVHVEAQEPMIAALVTSLERYYARRRG